MLPSAPDKQAPLVVDTSIVDVTLFPGVDRGREAEIIKDAVVLVHEGIVVYAGKREDAPDYVSLECIYGKGRLLMPSFANAHAHSAMTLLRGVGADMPLRKWLAEAIFPREKKLNEQIVRAGVELALLEHIRSGVTAVNDMYSLPRQTAQALGEANMRSLVCNACVEFGQGQKQLENSLLFHQEYHNSYQGRIRAGISVHAEYTTTRELVKSLIQACQGLDNTVHVHVSETAHEVEECYLRHGVSPVSYFHELGLFSMNTIAAHCVHVSEDDLDILALDKVAVALNPVSNLKLGSGIAPVNRMLAKGIAICIGTDGAASNDNLDFLEEVKLTGILHKGINKDPTLVSPAAVLQAAGVNGAKAMGFHNVGLIEEGWQADLILVDTEAPNLCPSEVSPALLVYAAKSENIDLVMCAGKLLYHKGEYLTLDKERILFEARLAANLL